jgi:hypothetical protein
MVWNNYDKTRISGGYYEKKVKSTISLISTKWTIISHLNSLNIIILRYNTLKIQLLALDRHKQLIAGPQRQYIYIWFIITFSKVSVWIFIQCLFSYHIQIICLGFYAVTLENTKGAIKNGQSRETGKIGHTRRRQTKQNMQHNICWSPLFANKHK